MAEAPKVEIIGFTRPVDAGLFLPRICWSQSRLELLQLLHAEFRKFGLLHSVFAEEGRTRSVASGTGGSWFAYVDFYSRRSALAAIAACGERPLTIGGQECSVVWNKRPKSTSRPLPLRKCQDLANHYLGFNGWNSQVLYHRLESAEEQDETIVVKHCSVVQVSFPRLPDCPPVEGVGLAEASYHCLRPDEKGEALESVQKQSKGTAFQSAFAKMLLIVVDDQKVTVSIDTTCVDPFFYDPTWESYEVHVNDMSSLYDVAGDTTHQ